MCKVISCGVGSGIFYDQCVLLAKLLAKAALPCFVLYSKAKFACCSRLLTTYFGIPVPYAERTSFTVLVLKGLVGLRLRETKQVKLYLYYAVFCLRFLGFLFRV